MRGDPVSLRDQLQGIYDERRSLTPADVVDVARDPEHPLHERFEWDDSVAGERWRQHQAGELIRSVKIAFVDPQGRPADVRAFHAVRSDKGHAYRPTDEIVQDEIATKVLLQDMEREWRALQARWSRFEEFSAMVRRDVEAA